MLGYPLKTIKIHTDDSIIFQPPGKERRPPAYERPGVKPCKARAVGQVRCHRTSFTKGNRPAVPAIQDSDGPARRPHAAAQDPSGKPYSGHRGAASTGQKEPANQVLIKMNFSQFSSVYMVRDVGVFLLVKLKCELN